MNRFSIKNYMIIFLIFLAALGIYLQKEYAPLLIQLAIAVSAALISDLAINYFKNKKIILPSSAVITGLIVGMVMAPGQDILFYILASFLAILSKHIFRYNNRNIFNPANLGLFTINILFGAYMGWWQVNLWFIVIPGIFIVFKTRRLHLVISFLLITLILLRVYAYLKQGEILDYLPLINLYFVFVMLIEPKTSPLNLARGIIFGCIVAIAGFVSYLYLPQYDYLLISLVFGNLFNLLAEALKRG